MSKVLQSMIFEEYLRHPAYGSSDIIKMRNSFAYWKAQKAAPAEKTRPLVVGSATHLLVQAEITSEPSLKSSVKTYKDGSSLTLGFKKFQADNPNFICLDEKEAQLCDRMLKALLDDPEVMRYLKDSIVEATVIANYPGTNVLTKCRPDYLHQGLGVSINLKTASDASESGFLYSAKDYGYDWQSSIYCTLLSDQLGKPFDEVHIVVEKGATDEECVVNLFSFGDDTLGFARSQIWEILQKIPECEKSGIWPKKRAFLNQLDMPLHMRSVVTP